jgi:hypothetical protein
MFKFLRLAGMIGAVFSVALAATLFQPELASDLGFKPWSLSWSPNGPPQQGPTILPGPESEAVIRRIEKKQRIVRELLAGRRTFFETAEVFRRLNDEYPKLLPHPAIHGDSDEERVCRQVIVWVRGTMQVDGYSDRTIEAVADCFERELHEHLRQHGLVCLPDSLETE